jgi:stress-induced morphogen
MERLELIENRLRSAFAPETLRIIDDSHLHAGHAGAKSGGGHFSVAIVSRHFKNQTTVQRHRMIYDALKDLIPKEIHALSIHALAPDEL